MIEKYSFDETEILLQALFSSSALSNLFDTKLVMNAEEFI